MENRVHVGLYFCCGFTTFFLQKWSYKHFFDAQFVIPLNKLACLIPANISTLVKTLRKSMTTIMAELRQVLIQFVKNWPSWEMSAGVKHACLLHSSINCATKNVYGIAHSFDPAQVSSLKFKTAFLFFSFL